MSFLHLLSKIWKVLTRKRKIQLGFLLGIMFISSFAELVSLASIIPFLSVLVDPSAYWEKPFVYNIAVKIGISSPSKLLLPATLLFGLAACSAAFVRLFTLYLNGRLAASIGSQVSTDVYRRMLYKSYSFHTNCNSSNLISIIATQAGAFTSAVNQILQFTTSFLVALGILIGLIYIDWQVALLSGILFVFVYSCIVAITKKRLLLNSSLNAEAIQNQLRALQEGLGAIREVLLDGNQAMYVNSYSLGDFLLRLRQANNEFLSTAPRFAVEAIGLLLISFTSYLLVIQRDNVTQVIPILGALALGAQRLLPALQQQYSALSIIRSNTASINSVLDILTQPVSPLASFESINVFSFAEKIVFKNVSYAYNDDSPVILNSINLTIKKGERIGIVGKTGCGKSTFLDLLMGLIDPDSGSIEVDGIDINSKSNPFKNLEWRKAIAHVPQSIYLCDTTILENIAFGVASPEIDLSRVHDAALSAQLMGVIDKSEFGYETYVGERGIKLSGGQRQRVGIARALYKQSSVLVFDEATSALDNATEQSVMQSIYDLDYQFTVIMIAHRLSTLANCDRIIDLDQINQKIQES